MKTIKQINAYQFIKSDTSIHSRTPNTVTTLISTKVNPIALPFFSIETSSEDADIANGENKPAPAPATALDMSKRVNVGATAVMLFAIVKMSIEYNNIFLM